MTILRPDSVFPIMRQSMRLEKKPSKVHLCCRPKAGEEDFSVAMISPISCDTAVRSITKLIWRNMQSFLWTIIPIIQQIPDYPMTSCKSPYLVNFSTKSLNFSSSLQEIRPELKCNLIWDSFGVTVFLPQIVFQSAKEI